jgi:hypothetical protein
MLMSMEQREGKHLLRAAEVDSLDKCYAIPVERDSTRAAREQEAKQAKDAVAQANTAT